mmetsp:Transcript_98050/g.261804  ORF Transcript_98050/g.261804 Transcript_98050/m.261804 type:complete len:681 (+) Transcript_98050:103-2145(+)
MFVKAAAVFSGTAAGFGHLKTNTNDHLELLQVGVQCEAVQSLAAQQTSYWRESQEQLALASTAVNASAQGVQEDVDEFLRQQQGPATTCHAKLYRYRNMLNHLHDDVNLVYSKEKALVQTIQTEEAVIDDLNRRIKSVVEKGKKKMAECKQAREESCKEQETYAAELKELKQIGHSPAQPLGLFQTVMKRARRATSNRFTGVGSNQAALNARSLLSAHRELQACMASTPGASVALLQLEQPDDFEPTGEEVSEQKFADTITFGEKECNRARVKLEQAWRKSFMSIEDLFDTSRAACEDDSCEKAVEAELETTLPPMHQEQADRIKTIRLAQHELVGVRSEMETLEKTLKKVEIATKEAQDECGALEKGSKYLEEVRELIQGMKRCPGTIGAAFTIPEFQRTAMLTDFDVTSLDQKELDAKLTEACKAASPEHDKDDVRAATALELKGRLVDNLPHVNTESIPLYGTCPGCHGEQYAGAAAGRLRRCFKKDAKVCCKGESKDCNGGMALAVCVIDRSLAERGMGQVDLTFYFGTELPEGAEGILDGGAGFGNHQGLMYGWDCNGNTEVDYDSGRRKPSRGGGLGLNHFDRANTCRDGGGAYLPVNWQVQVPNGEYQVTVKFPERYHKDCEVEGDKACTPDSENKVCTYDDTVKVKDGKFTITGYGHDSGRCHSMSMVKITK